MNSLAKKSLVIAGATLLAVTVSAQVRNRANAIRMQNVIVTNYGGTGGVITGPPPVSLSPFVVVAPVPLGGGTGGAPTSAGIDR